MIFSNLYNKLLLFLYVKTYGYFKGFKVQIIGNVNIGKYKVIGDGSHIAAGAKGSITIETSVSIGRDIWIGAGDANIMIEKESLFGPRVCIVGQNHSSTEITITNLLPWQRDSIPKDVHIGKRCHIGANVVILPGTNIGDYCTIGANSVVSGEIKSNSLIVGATSRVVKVYDFSVTNDNIKTTYPPYRHVSSKFF